MNSKRLTVYYDGLCKVCSREINHYKAQAGAENILFVDICSDLFDAKKEGLDPVQVHRIMHVRKGDGTIVTRVDAFVEIWKVLPRYQFLAKWAESPLLRHFLELGYSGFVKLRPYLPRSTKEDSCAESPYCEIISKTKLENL